MGAEIPDGAVLVARAILNSSLWTMSKEDRLVAITCICVASFRPRKWWDGKETVLVGRGQFVRGRKKFAEECNLTEDELRTSMDHLEKVGFLTRKVTSRYTLFTLPKYDHYQDMSKYSDSCVPEKSPALRTTCDVEAQEVTETDAEKSPDFAPALPQRVPNAGPTGPQRVPTYKNDKNEKNEKNEKNSLSARNGSVESHIVSAWNNGPGFPIGHPQGQKLVRAYIDSGLSAQRQLEAVSNQPECKGKKFWEVLEPLRPAQSTNGVGSIEDILKGMRYST